jgi:hypothetical protein
VLSERGILAANRATGPTGPTGRAAGASASLAAAYKIVRSGARMIDLHPHDRCAFCDAHVDSRIRFFISARPESHEGPERPEPADSPETRMWLPTLSACGACPPRDNEASIGIWRAFFFSIDRVDARYPSMRVRVRADEPEAYTPLFGEGAEESAWQANDRVVAALALALQRGAHPNEGTFAASLARVLCDFKLLRIVAACTPRPQTRATQARALTIVLSGSV